MAPQVDVWECGATGVRTGIQARAGLCEFGHRPAEAGCNSSVPPVLRAALHLRHGRQSTLNARINEIFRQGDPSADMAERLYNEFVKAQDANERISDRKSTRLNSVT